MARSAELVSIGLPVYNAGVEIEGVVRSVLAQDHEELELVISDNASTDDTEDVCRGLAGADKRIAYHRQATNVGQTANFTAVLRLARGEYFRWIGDDDRLEPTFASRSLTEFRKDPRLILVTSQISYTDVDGRVQTYDYEQGALTSDDPVERLTEMLRLLNANDMFVDPLYGLIRRGPILDIPRPIKLREDEIFAAKLALRGPWGHVNEVLAHRNRRGRTLRGIARVIGVPMWHAYFANDVQYRDLAAWLGKIDLTDEQRAGARRALRRWYLQRHRGILVRRGRKLVRMVVGG